MAPTESESKAAAQAIKSEANVLFQSRKFKEAYDKYGEAIAFDDTNAILFANRAACSLELEEYLNAGCDARKATKLDPKYIKAWARLGKASQALRAYHRSIDAWESALACYLENTSGLSEVDKQLKASCEAGLRDAKNALKEAEKPQNDRVVIINKSVIDRGLLPWQIAERLEVDINKIGQSSAWVILNAHREFERGCEKMFKTVETDSTVSGPIGAIADITNGLLRDGRAFAATTPDWIDTYNRQIIMEIQYYGAWPGSGPAEVQQKALALQKEKGFQACRGALGMTVRGWFMRAYLEEKGSGDPKSALEFYRSSLSVLEWGLKTWKDVPDSERGAIFTPTFIRGIRRHYLNAYLSACRGVNFRSTPGLDCEELDKLAEEQIEETKRNRPEGSEDYLRDGGFFCSFFLYPVAEALAIRGAIAIDKGVKLKATDPERASEYLAQAKRHYMVAYNILPKDEEFRLLYIKVAIEAAWHRGDTLSECLAMVELMTADRPAVSKIWNYSVFKKNLDVHMAQIGNFQEQACMGIIEGDFSVHSPATLINLYEC
ncbi:hypothetical protein BDY19DRAFT_912986 [Irpex rosettiformis]|uniref:Uncharacterized protein n=1 Tax=Irpex rosettiformis TaxID=378272 RepID=A0ACB8UJF5_9APHY|nr:hypothetical protein BDY19DRAFT_912986 [Irpex rosettiformis]